MGLSDATAIREWLKNRGGSGEPAVHEWEFVGAEGFNIDEASIRAACRSCGLIRRKPLSSNAEIFIDLSGPCPGDSTFWIELQEQRVRSKPSR